MRPRSHGRGWCNPHYQAWYREQHRRPSYGVAVERICKFPKCGRKHEARGYCSRHYQQWMRGRLELYKADRRGIEALGQRRPFLARRLDSNRPALSFRLGFGTIAG